VIYDFARLAFKYLQQERELGHFDGLIVDVMRNPGGDGCYAESLLQRLIPYRFRGTGQEVRVTRDWVLAFSNLFEILEKPDWSTAIIKTVCF
jgi:hypothetical protein